MGRERSQLSEEVTKPLPAADSEARQLPVNREPHLAKKPLQAYIDEEIHDAEPDLARRTPDQIRDEERWEELVERSKDYERWQREHEISGVYEIERLTGKKILQRLLAMYASDAFQMGALLSHDEVKQEAINVKEGKPKFTLVRDEYPDVIDTHRKGEDMKALITDMLARLESHQPYTQEQYDFVNSWKKEYEKELRENTQSLEYLEENEERYHKSDTPREKYVVQKGELSQRIEELQENVGALNEILERQVKAA